MVDPIDYSRPVGWWCPVCGASGKQTGSTLLDELLVHGIIRCCTSGAADEMCFAIVIPVYLPIPEGQRPPAASEVEEAEVVTFTSLLTGRFRISGIDIEIGHDGNARGSWSDEGELVLDPDTVVNFCAEQSARARIVTGATE